MYNICCCGELIMCDYTVLILKSLASNLQFGMRTNYVAIFLCVCCRHSNKICNIKKYNMNVCTNPSMKTVDMKANGKMGCYKALLTIIYHHIGGDSYMHLFTIV